MKTLSSQNSEPRYHRVGVRVPSGFTLVELLVALGLVSLLLLMFAQVFQIATETMSVQRGIMENDQRARSVTTVIRRDLAYRSMQSVMPFIANEVDYPVAGYFSFSRRQGFLSVSENNPNDDADDVLHFTSFLNPQLSDELSAQSSEFHYGKALALQNNLVAHPNQPDADDAYLFAPNSSAMSKKAEIVYFVRNGNLYRRVLLIREPIDENYGLQPGSGADGSGPLFFDPANAFYTTGSFWNDYDFSAQFDSVTGFVQFNGSAHSGGLTNSGGEGVRSIARPFFRYGHDPVTGNPREYVNGNADFIGRFTQEETSHADFIYPRAVPAIGRPTRQDIPLTLNANRIVTDFANGPRRGEDLLMSNVHAFDVKLWDESVGDYVDVGSANSIDFPRNVTSTYGPNSPAGNRVFDTWHPQIDLNSDSVNDTAPILPVYTAATSGWTANGVYKIGDVVVPTAALTTGFAYQVSEVQQITRDAMTNDILNVQQINFATSASTEPSSVNTPANPWTTVVGLSTAESEYAINATTSTQIIWTAIPIVKRVKSLKITIRYLDVSSDQMRQVSLIQSLVN